MRKLKIPKNELDNLYHLFKAGNIQLTIELCEGLNYDYVDLLEYLWDNDNRLFSGSDKTIKWFLLDLGYHAKFNFWYSPDLNEYQLYCNIKDISIFDEIDNKNEALTLLYKYLKEQ